jgi:multidrug resistance efflux pump
MKSVIVANFEQGFMSQTFDSQTLVSPEPHNLFPKKREDLSYSDQKLQDETVYLVVDNATDSYHYFYDINFAIFLMLDGKTSLLEIKQKIEELFPDAEVSLEDIQSFIVQLQEKGLLEGSEKRLTQTRKRTLAQENIFFFRVFSINFDPVAEKFLSFFSLLFEKPFVFIALAFIAWSFIFSFSLSFPWVTLSLLLSAFFAGKLAFFFELVLAGTTSGFFHELGHAMACKKFGGNVREAGLLFYFFLPAFYADVSSASAFRNKTHKIIVGLAGVYLQLFVSALAMLLWYFLVPQSPLYNFLVLLIGAGGFFAILNFIPLIKLDGYYILCDWLEVLNLRENAFRYLSLLLQKWLFNLEKAQNELDLISIKLRKIYFWYAFFGMLYTIWLLWRVFRLFSNLLLSHFKQSGFGTLLLLAGIFLVLKKIWQRRAPAMSELLKKIKESSKAKWFFLIRLKKTTIFFIIIVFLGLIPSRWPGLKGNCVVRPSIKRALAPLESGVVAKIFQHEGEAIKKGEVFAQLDDFNVRKELTALLLQKKALKKRLAYLSAAFGTSLTQANKNFQQAKLNLEAHDILAYNELEKAKNAMQALETRYRTLHKDIEALNQGDLPEELAQIDEELIQAKNKLAFSKNEWNRYQTLASQFLVSPKEVEEKHEAYENARSEVSRLKDKLDFAKKKLFDDENVAFHEYTASRQAYEALLKQVSIIDPQKLQKEVKESRKILNYTEAQKTEIQEVKAQLKLLDSTIAFEQQKLMRLQIKSPIDGVIMTPHVKELEGQRVEKGQPIAWVYHPGSMIFEIHIDELDISQVPHPNDKNNKVEVRLLAFPNQSFSGKILRIVPESLPNSAIGTYLVDVKVEDPSKKLLPGMMGTGKIYGKPRPILWQLLRRPVEYVLWKLWGLF